MKARTKALMLISAALAVASCSAPRLIEVHMADFRPYEEIGFSFYAGECLEPHRQLGMIHVEITPGTMKKDKRPKQQKQGRFEDPVYSKGVLSGRIEVLTGKDILDPMMSAAKEMGGNGIAHLEIRYDGVKYHARGTAVLCR